MKYIYGTAAAASFCNSILAFAAGQPGFAIGLLGGAGAWCIVTVSAYLAQKNPLDRRAIGEDDG